MNRPASTLLLAALAFALPAAALAMECPAPQPIGGAAPPAVSATLKQQLTGADPYGAVKAMYSELRGAYPNAPKADLVNYLVAAFCPIVNATPGIGEDLKKARVNSFADGVLAVAY